MTTKASSATPDAFHVLNNVIHNRLMKKSRNFASVKLNFLLMDKEDIKEIKRILYAIEIILTCIAISIAAPGLHMLLK